VLLIHGTEDSLVPVDNSERLAAAYTAHGAPVELIVLPGVGHAFAGSEPEPMVDTSLDYLQPFLDPTN
jgi:dipeptidyl aminopeptidase/acylaminoacyl peptidase